MVDKVSGPILVLNGRGRVLDRVFICPGVIISRALFDPLLEELKFLGGDFFVGFRGRHNLLRVLIKNSRNNFRSIGFSGFDRDFEFSAFRRSLVCVESQFSFSGFFVGAVAVKTLVGKDGANIAIEINRGMSGCGANEVESDGFQREKRAQYFG